MAEKKIPHDVGEPKDLQIFHKIRFDLEENSLCEPHTSVVSVKSVVFFSVVSNHHISDECYTLLNFWGFFFSFQFY